MAIPGKIFISYRRSDTEGYAGRIFDRLGAKFGRENIFMDVDTIQPGENFVEAIENAVSSCDVLIALIGDEWLTITDEDGKRRLDNPNDFVHVEITSALKRGIRVIPVLLAGTAMPKKQDLPKGLQPLTELNALEIRHGSFDPGIEKLQIAIDTCLREIHAPQTPAIKKLPIWAWVVAISGIFMIGFLLWVAFRPKLTEPATNIKEVSEASVPLLSENTATPTQTQTSTVTPTPEKQQVENVALNTPVPTNTFTPEPTITQQTQDNPSTPTDLPTNLPTPTLNIPYGEMILEPMDRIIEHILPDPGVRMNYARNIWQRDLIAEATFHNPYSNTVGPWDIGFMFRDMGKQDDTGLKQLRLVISSDGIWYLMDFIGNSLTDTDQGLVDNLDTSEGGKNVLILVANGEVGSFYLNGVKIADLDLSTRMNSGGVAAAVSFLPGRNIEMGSTEIEGFTVWDINQSP